MNIEVYSKGMLMYKSDSLNNLEISPECGYIDIDIVGDCIQYFFLKIICVITHCYEVSGKPFRYAEIILDVEDNVVVSN